MRILGRLWNSVLAFAIGLAALAMVITIGVPAAQAQLAERVAKEIRHTGYLLDPRDPTLVETAIGVAVGIELPGKQPEFSAAGTNSLKTGRPRLSTDIQPIASVTKTFTAVLILRTIEGGGCFKLRDTLAEVVQNCRHDGGNFARLLADSPYSADIRAITVRQLLNHTGGLGTVLDSETFQRLFNERPTRRWSLNELARIALHQKPLSAPGVEQQYSNNGYLLLGLVLEAANNKPIAEQMTDLFEIAGMDRDRTFYAPSIAFARELGDRFVRGYQGPGRGYFDLDVEGRPTPAFLKLYERVLPRDSFRFLEDAQKNALFPLRPDGTQHKPINVGRRAPLQLRRTLWNVTFKYDTSIAGSAGAVVTSAPDLTRFWKALFTPGRLLSLHSLHEMQKTVPIGRQPGNPDDEIPDLKKARYGLGLARIPIPPGFFYAGSPALTIWTHGGDLDGYHTAAAFIEGGGKFNGTVITALSSSLESSDLLIGSVGFTLFAHR